LFSELKNALRNQGNSRHPKFLLQLSGENIFRNFSEFMIAHVSNGQHHAGRIEPQIETLERRFGGPNTGENRLNASSHFFVNVF
jgi:hypothetical protein